MPKQTNIKNGFFLREIENFHIYFIIAYDNKFKVVALRPAIYFGPNKCLLTDMMISVSAFTIQLNG